MTKAELQKLRKRAGVKLVAEGDDFVRRFVLKDGRPRAPKHGDYVKAQWLAEKIGMHRDTITRMFEKERDGIIRRTTQGKNRRVYTTTWISLKAARRKFPDAGI